MNKPRPPAELSSETYVQNQWNSILQAWRRGWGANHRVETISEFLEERRKKIFDEKSVDLAQYDYEEDWIRAKTINEYNLDLVDNTRVRLSGVKEYWKDWVEVNLNFQEQLSLQALKSMILVNGAAILTSLAALSGQIQVPSYGAVIAAKLMVLTSVVSLIMLTVGHAVVFKRSGRVSSTIRATLIGNPRHSKLNAIGRYFNRHMVPVGELGEALIYGSILVFSLSALVSAFIFVFAG